MTAFARVHVGDRVVRLSVEALGLAVVERDGLALPVEDGRVIGREEWPAWCEQNAGRIEAAAARPAPRKPKAVAQAQVGLFG